MELKSFPFSIIQIFVWIKNKLLSCREKNPEKSGKRIESKTNTREDYRLRLMGMGMNVVQWGKGYYLLSCLVDFLRNV